MDPNKKKKIFAAALCVAGLWCVHYYTVTRLTKVTSLMRAARSGDAAWVERELRSGANPNRVWNESGFRWHGTCAFSCTTRPNSLCERQLENIRLLLGRGARRAGISRFGKDIDWCLRDRPIDPYRQDLEALLGTSGMTDVGSKQ